VSLDGLVEGVEPKLQGWVAPNRDDAGVVFRPRSRLAPGNGLLLDRSNVARRTRERRHAGSCTSAAASAQRAVAGRA
jgi:hypothetical protein